MPDVPAISDLSATWEAPVAPNVSAGSEARVPPNVSATSATPAQPNGSLAPDMPAFLTDLPRFVFFTGKGGVGKTSLACAAAVLLADAGRRVLLVSTDPASNIGQVFGQRFGNRITPIGSVPNADAIEIDPEAAAAGYRESILAPVRDLLPAIEVASITEQLSGSCTTEIASFNEFTRLLADDAVSGGYDHVIFDTAPTGHTIRLMELPGEWSSFIDDGKGDASCLGPMAGLEKSRATYQRAVDRLADATITRLVLVTRAQPSALQEAARTAGELARLGITAQHLVVNAVLPQPGPDADPLARAIAGREQTALSQLPETLRPLTRTVIPLRATTMVGVDALRHLFAAEPDGVGEASRTPSPASTRDDQLTDVPGLDALVDELADADHGLIMCMGKGGVGKTTVAAAIALALARRGHEVHLSTTDPAAHLTEVLADAGDAHLEVSRIDPDAATQAYRDRVMRTKGASLDEVGRAQLAEDLQSPCTEEVAVFSQFAHLVAQARRQFVVIDTAPTGHTLLLMDATGSYHREIMRGLGTTQGTVTPLMRLQDPDLTRVIIVTLPDLTPVLEAEGLAADLRRADITPWAWVVNQSLAAAHPTDRLLVARADAEAPHLGRVRELADRVALLPMLPVEPTGEDALLALTSATGSTVTDRALVG